MRKLHQNDVGSALHPASHRAACHTSISSHWQCSCRRFAALKKAARVEHLRSVVHPTLQKRRQGTLLCTAAYHEPASINAHHAHGVPFSSQEICEATGGQLMSEGLSGSISTDTRTLQDGQWFLALQGSNHDGHNFMSDAFARGCAGVIASKTLPGIEGRGLVVVPDTRQALRDLALRARQRFSGPVVGITGSCGKTTTRVMTGLVLRSLGKVHQTRGNQNNDVGVPLTLLAMPPDAAAAVIEIGMSAPLEISRSAAVALPTVRVITNVGPSHLAGVGGTLEGVARAKAELLEGVRAGDVAVLNADDSRVAALRLPKWVRRVTFGAAAEACDVRVLSAKACGPGGLGTELVIESTLSGRKEGMIVRLDSPAAHLAMNAAAAVAVGGVLGIPFTQMAENLARYTPEPMRMQPQHGRGIIVLNDAYNANPVSMRAALRVLAGLPRLSDISIAAGAAAEAVPANELAVPGSRIAPEAGFLSRSEGVTEPVSLPPLGEADGGREADSDGSGEAAAASASPGRVAESSGRTGGEEHSAGGDRHRQPSVGNSLVVMGDGESSWGRETGVAEHLEAGVASGPGLGFTVEAGAGTGAGPRVEEGARLVGRRVVALGDMRELGPAESEAHLSVLRECQHLGFDVVGIVGPAFRSAAEIAFSSRAGGLEPVLNDPKSPPRLTPANSSTAPRPNFKLPRLIQADSSAELGHLLRGVVRAGDAVLVKGSREMRMERVAEALLEEKGSVESI